MRTDEPAPLSGRRAQAARNDGLILDAARAVFVADPSASIAAVAERAGVGMSALYRRFGSKQELLAQLSADGLEQYIAAVEAALADDEDPWRAFVGFMQAVTEADTHSLTQRLAGTFTPTEALNADAERSHELLVRLFERVQAAGAIRPDLVADDLAFLFEQLAAVRVRDPQRRRELRLRYLALQLEALHGPAAGTLPGPAPTWGEVAERWDA